MTKKEIDETPGLTDLQRLELYSKYGISEEYISDDEYSSDSENKDDNKTETKDDKIPGDDIPSGDEEDLLDHKKTQTKGDNKGQSSSESGFNQKEFDQAETSKDFSPEEMYEIAQAIVAMFTLSIIVLCRYVSLGRMPESQCSPSDSAQKTVVMLLAKVLYKYQYKFPIVFALIFTVIVVYAPPIYEATKYRKVKKYEDEESEKSRRQNTNQRSSPKGNSSIPRDEKPYDNPNEGESKFERGRKQPANRPRKNDIVVLSDHLKRKDKTGA